MIRMKKLLVCLLSACMVLTMFPVLAFADGAASGTEDLPESEHNYADNYDNTWTYQMDCAHNGLYVTFDEQTETESNYDFIDLLDGNEQQVGKYSGKELSGKTVYISTPSFKIRLTSDNGTNRWGFKVSNIEMAGEFVDLEKVGSVDEISPVFVNEEVEPVVRLNDQILSKDTDYDVSAVTNTVGTQTATITGKGSFTGTLKQAFQVVDENNLADGATVAQANISLRQGSDTGTSYVSFNNATSAWTSAIESMTLTPVEADGVTKTDTGSAAYPNAPAEITLTADQLKVNGNRISFERTADNPVVYVMEGHDPVSISSRWGSNTYPQSQNYLVTVKARGYKDTTGTTTYYTGTAPEFSIIVDSDGDVSTTDDRTVAKSWNSEEIAAMAEFANGSSQCGMTGFRTFSGEGVSLKKLLEEADISISDSDYFLLDTSDHYGNYFTYDSLFNTKRYFMSSIYEEGFAAYYAGLASSDDEAGSIDELRRYLAAHATKQDVVEPRINVRYVETMISGDDLAEAVLPTAENQDYNSLVAYENQFRFFYGLALVQDEHNVTYDSQGGTETASQLVKSHPMTSTENSTMKSSYWASSLVVFRGAGEQYKTEPSAALNKITRPVDPSRTGYTFAGWYTDKDCKDGSEFDFKANDGYVDEDITLYAKWVEGATLPESDHEYESSTDRTWSYDYGEGADNGLVVKFSDETSTETNYDFIYVYDADGNELGKYSGKELAGKSVYVPGSKVLIRLASDRSGNDYGFKVDRIEPNGDTIDLSLFGKIGKIDAVEVNGKPTVPVTVNNVTLTENTDYTVSYDTSKAGITKATVTGTGKYSGSLSKDFMVYDKAIKITAFDITNTEHNDADQELNQTIIATVTFDSDIKLTADDLKDDLLITVAGGDVNNTARDITYEVKGNQLVITMVSTDWVAIYNGMLSISESDNGLLHLIGTKDGEAVVWETQAGRIPTGIVVENQVTPGTASQPASTIVTVTHKANMRGMYFFDPLSIVGGEETVIGESSGVSHAHNFYGSITKEAIAKAIAGYISGLDGYSATYVDGEDHFTFTADTATEGETLAVRMNEINAQTNYVKEETPSVTPSTPSSGGTNKVNQNAVKSVEDKINAIGTVTEQSGDVIKTARDAYNALTPFQKSQVSDAAKKALADAEAAFEALNKTPEPPVDTNPYSDVKEDAWYYDNVRNVTKKGIFQGSGNGVFDPERDMTRAEFAQVLYNMEGKPAAAASTSFHDVANGSWYADAVGWAASTDCGNGEMLVKGYPDGSFQPDATITREQMVTLMNRYAQYKKMDTSKKDSLSAFTDKGSVQDYALDSVQWAVAEGIIKGMTPNTLEPASNTTRAQVAAVLDRFTDRIQ